jgi:hypothetical protein
MAVLSGKLCVGDMILCIFSMKTNFNCNRHADNYQHLSLILIKVLRFKMNMQKMYGSIWFKKLFCSKYDEDEEEIKH